VPDDLRTAFARLRAEDPPAAPPLADVRRSGRRLRRRRRAVTVTAAVAVVAAVAGLGTALRARQSAPVAPPITPTVVPTAPPRPTGPTPAATRTSGTAVTGYDDFLHPGDLGTGWINAARPAGEATALSAPRCTSAQDSQVAAAGVRFQTLVRRFDAGDGVWQTSESAGTVTTTEAATLRTRLAAAASCSLPRDSGLPRAVIASRDGLLITAMVLPSGQLGRTVGYAVAGGHYLMVGSDVGTEDQASYPLPGQAPWAVGVLLDAVQRLTGTRPAAPAVRPQFRTADPAVPAEPGPGLLRRGDLGTAGSWTHPYASPRNFTGIGGLLPSCTARQGAPPTVPGTKGKGAVQWYSGWTGTGPDSSLDNLWTLAETITVLSAADGARARQALAAAARCTAVNDAATGEPMPLIAGSAGTVVVAVTTGGRLRYGQSWALSGNTLVHLETKVLSRTARRDTGDTTPVGPGWLVDLTRTALGRTAGGR
jgi:hypothetical protein